MVNAVFHRNLEKPETPTYTVKAHKEIVNCIDGVGGLGVGDGAPEIVTGSRDGESAFLFVVCIVMSCSA